MCEPEAVAEAVRAQYVAFLAHAAAPADLTVHIALTPGASASALLDARLRPEGEDFLLDVPGGCGRISLASRNATLTASGAAPLTEVEYFLRITVALLAYHRGGLLVHAAGLLVEGQAHLFIGQSGSGKTTVVSLSGHAVALSDDLVLLRPGPQGWTAHGTPFWNSETVARQGQTASGPLAGIYKLIQDRSVYLAPMSPVVGAAELFASCPVVNGPPTLTAGVLGRCRALVGDVPVQGLHFRKDDSFWAVVRSQPPPGVEITGLTTPNLQQAGCGSSASDPGNGRGTLE